MTNENVTIDDLQATASAKAEEAKEVAQEKLETVKDTVRNINLTTNQKLLLTGAAAVVASTIIQRVVTKLRTIRIDESVNVDKLIVLSPEDVETE